ncbi:MAG: hypothetical protein LBQ59_04155 [Candidatus Peribacteria bacterium]|jgi:hypothetical protein|nr:hypothetical protein [Candidatus Peribacteria bacterium]
MTIKKDNKKHKDSVEEISLDDLDILKEIGITEEEIKDFNKDESNKNNKEEKKKEKKIKKEKNQNDNNIEEKIIKLDNDIFNFEEDDNGFLDLDYDEF